MPVRAELKIDRSDLELKQTVRTARRLVKESPRLIAEQLAKELRQGDGSPGAFPNPARPDGKTGYPVRTGLARSSFRSTHDGAITNRQGYTKKLEQEGKWAGTVRRYVEDRLLAIAKDVRDKVLGGRSGRRR